MIEIQVNVLIRIATPSDATPEPTAEELSSAIPAAMMQAGLKFLSGAAGALSHAPVGVALLADLSAAFAKPLGEHHILGIYPRGAGPMLSGLYPSP